MRFLIRFLKRIPYKFLLYFPILLCIIGAAMNAAVLIANHGGFPVQFPSYESCASIGKDDLIHICMTADTSLNFLADWIQTGFGVMSPGDILLDIGSFIQWPFFWIWFVFALDTLLKRSDE